MNMKTVSAAEAKTHFGKFIDTAQHEPVMVTKHNRPVGVMFSMHDIENTIWGEEAKKAHTDGYIGEKKSADLLNNLLHAHD